MDYSKQPSHNVLCVDMKSFYASCESVLRGLDPLTAKLVVVGDINRSGSVVLASSPVMKSQYGIKTGSRLFEVKDIIKKYKDNSIIIAQARMEYYLTQSKEIVKIFERFVPPNAIHVYSVDESWLCTNGCERLWGTPMETAEKIRNTIKEETGLIATIGISDNKFLAKLVLDVYGKKDGISEVRYKDVKDRFHHLPVNEMWGIGAGITKRLNLMNVFTIGDLAHMDIQQLKNEFGVVGEQLWQYSWGIDHSPVFYDENNPPPSAFGFFNDDTPNSNIKSIGRGVTLLRDYVDEHEIIQVIRDLTLEVCEILRKRKMVGKTIHLSIGYSRTEKSKGFSRQISFKNHRSNDVEEILNQCIELFKKHHKKNSIVRQARLSVGNLQHEPESERTKKRKVYDAMDKLNNKHGIGMVRTASSFLNSSIANSRKNKIGGHTK